MAARPGVCRRSRRHAEIPIRADGAEKAMTAPVVLLLLCSALSEAPMQVAGATAAQSKLPVQVGGSGTFLDLARSVPAKPLAVFFGRPATTAAPASAPAGASAAQ